jgi:hypothetical protein
LNLARSRRGELESLPRREELGALARRYHHLQRGYQEASPDSSVRRHIEERLSDVRERFDRLLAEWVPEEEVREEWRRFLDHHAPEPDRPPAIEPLVFRGIGEVTGSILEVRGSGDEYRVNVDGALSERLIAEKDFAATGPPLTWRYDDVDYRETFDVSEDALDALAEFVEAGAAGSPPWDYATELFADGLVDVHFALTPRGRRALA